MRFIDYGTRSDGLQQGDLYAWDSILDTVPPQAAACSFFGVPVKIRDKKRFSCEECKVFTELMKQSSPMDMKVHKIIHTVQSSDTELLVSLDSKDCDILTQLSHKETFREYFALQEVPNLLTACLLCPTTLVNLFLRLKPSSLKRPVCLQQLSNLKLRT